MSPINLKLYPSDWKTAIRPRILKRDRHRCRVCKVKNYTWGYREPDGTFVPALGWSKEKGKTDREGHRIFRIQLNVAHVDHGLSDHSDANLKTMCVRCHVLYDRRVTAPKAGFTLKYGRGTGLLPFDGVPVEAEQLAPAFA
jgi:hypothetical protein